MRRIGVLVGLSMIIGVFVLAPAPAGASETVFSEVTAVVGYDDSLDASIETLVERLGGEVIAKHARLRFAVVATEDPEAFVAAAATRPGVRYAERDPLVFPEHTPLDQYYSMQWGMPAIDAPLAWDTEKGDGAVVAVLDTGVNWQHPDLLASTWFNLEEIPGDGIDNDNNGYVDDHVGWDFSSNTNDPRPGGCGDHGTHVAGIVAATQDNLLGVTGVAPQAKIMALRMLCAGNHLSAAALAVAYAADNGADIVTCSWYATYTLTAFEEAVRDAYQNANVLFVKSAGNQYGGPVTYPGNLPEFIAVSSLDSNLALSSFSSQGAKVELAAPGRNIISTVGIGNSYDQYSGTSMAAPHVAGTAALLFAKDPSATNLEVRSALTASARDLGAPGRDTKFGFGIVDADGALALI